MKKTLLIGLAIFFSANLFSQQPFAPPGAVWHYDIIFMSYGGFVKYEATIDTAIQGITCRKIEKSEYRWFSIGPGQVGFQLIPFPPEFIYQNGDTVFWITQNLFRVLYNFNSTNGSTWTVTDSMGNGMGFGGCDSLSIVSTDSTGTENINGENLRYLAVHPDTGSPMGFFGRIYERMGSMNILFPEYAYCDTNIIMDAPFYRLHCYEDSLFGLYNADTSDCEWWWILNTDKITNPDQLISIYPNPASQSITIDAHISSKSLVVFNSFGQVVMTQFTNGWLKGYRINLDSFSEGIYIIRLETDSGPVTKSFLKL